MDLGNLTSIAQLACAYTLILGGYSSFRHRKEDHAEMILDRAQDQLSEIIQRTNPPQLTGQHNRRVESFEIIDWDETPLRLLNRHRSFATSWYYSEKKLRWAKDHFRSTILMIVGFASLSLLFISSLHPDYHIQSWLGWTLAFSVWVPPLLVMAEIWLEDRSLANQIYGNPPDRRENHENLAKVKKGDVEQAGQSTTPKMRHHPVSGHLYALTNDIHRKYRIFKEQRWRN